MKINDGSVLQSKIMNVADIPLRSLKTEDKEERKIQSSESAVTSAFNSCI
jgi:hypothetical protein